MKTYIIHHNDLDGYAAAGIAKAYLMKEGHTPILIEMDYSLSLPNIFEQDDVIYMLDFSLQPFREKMIPLAEAVDEFIWIDHHATVIKEYDEYKQERQDNWYIKGMRNPEFCGAELTWAWFKLEPGQSISSIKQVLENIPPALCLVGDWDTWRHAKMPDSQAPYFKLAFDTCTPAEVIDWFETYNNKINDYYNMSVVVTDKINQGVSIELFKRMLSADLMKSMAFEAKMSVPLPGPLGGSSVHNIIAANIGIRGSDAFSSVYDPKRHEMMLRFVYENTGKVSVSLYSTNPDINCGDLAKRCGDAGPFPGGGGHKGAAGFQTSWEFLMYKLLTVLGNPDNG